jgi:hypothetical protein
LWILAASDAMRDDVEFLCKIFVFNPKDLACTKPEANEGDGADDNNNNNASNAVSSSLKGDVISGANEVVRDDNARFVQMGDKLIISSVQ